MNLFPLLPCICFFITITVAANNPIHSTEGVSINCGSPGHSAVSDGREWLGDARSPRLQIVGSSASSTALPKLSSADPVPHKTARVSRSRFSYVFQVNPGQQIIRLHFYPTTYRGFRGLSDLFTVEAGPFTLLGNFSPALTADALGVSTFAKEFCLNVAENQELTITFSPKASRALDTYAFINGIEIISVPASLSYFGGADTGLQMVGQKSLVYVDNGTALEIIRRVNIRQDPDPPARDFEGMFPKWAIERAEKMKNDAWKIPVEVGFRYLIRLHFSEMGLKIARNGGVTFEILINEMVAHSNRDIMNEMEENNILLYRDYLVKMGGLKHERKRDLLISQFAELIDGHGVLAGFEVVKMSNADNSLASPNPQPRPQDAPCQIIRILLLVLGHTNATATVTIAIISLLNIIVHKLREICESSYTEEENKPSAKAERLCRRFSLVEIQLATDDFSDRFVIGRGGFGKVYKGLIDKGQKTVAIKRLKSNSRQGAREFLTEIEMLSELRHINLVSLIGYCSERREMIIVYEYMPCGTLADHLHKLARDNSTCSSLTWKQRLDICIGAARGLDYLHTGHRVIHRDVKPSNILLDENFVAKVSDFGLAKPEDRSKSQSYVSTKVKGTFGYLDPYYFTTQKLTRKSDTYAFGVVLLETLCGRPAVDSTAVDDERVLTKWARDKISEGEVEQIVSSSLREEISLDSLNTYVGAAERCLSDEPKNRPTMCQVVVQLELAIEQQESKSLLCQSNEDIISSESVEQTTEASTYVQTVTYPAKQTNSNYSPIGKRDSRKPKTSPLWIWTWDALWSRIKPSKKRESDFCEADIKLPKFDFASIATATNQFSYSRRIGEGRHSSVYKAVLPTGHIVAVKTFFNSSWVNNEFKTEIHLVSSLQHQNTVKLLGYCIDKQGDIILVYEYMARRDLSYNLHECENAPLTWKQRLKICIGTAKGLHYLHAGANLPIIHRDVNSTSILLDEKCEAKITGFSFSSSLGRKIGDDTHINTLVCGTIGYLDPEYFMTCQLTSNSDAFSFGVVMFEVLCGKPAIIQSQEEERRSLVEWASVCIEEERIEEIIDSNLKGQIAPECLSKFTETALACLKTRGTERPEMSDIVWRLEYAMQLQEEAESRGRGMVGGDGIPSAEVEFKMRNVRS